MVLLRLETETAMNLKDLQDELAAVAAERGLGPQQNPKNLAMAVAADAGALLGLFQWLSEEQSWRLGGPGEKDAAAAAIANVTTHALRLADELGIDLEAAIQAQLAPKAPVREARPAARQARPVATPVEPPPAPPAPIEPPRAEEPPPPAAPPPAARHADEMSAEPPAPKKERRAPPDSTPNWLDGLISPRPAPRGKRSAPEPKPPLTEPKPAPPPPETVREPAAVVAVEDPTSELVVPEPTGVVHAPAVVRDAGPKWDEVQPAGKERYTDLDPDATKTLVRSLAKRVSAAKSDDPLLRDLHDELETLRRTLYGPNPKRSWLADSLMTIRNMLEEATQVSLGDEIRADEHLVQIERMLGP
jgi:hypothetical protein